MGGQGLGVGGLWISYRRGHKDINPPNHFIHHLVKHTLFLQEDVKDCDNDDNCIVQGWSLGSMYLNIHLIVCCLLHRIQDHWSNLDPLWLSSLGLPGGPMIPKGAILAYLSHFGTLWRPPMAISDPVNGSHTLSRMWTTLIQPWSTLIQQFGVSRMTHGHKGKFWSNLDSFWP